jgi:hypothetical protein
MLAKRPDAAHWINTVYPRLSVTSVNISGCFCSNPACFELAQHRVTAQHSTGLHPQNFNLTPNCNCRGLKTSRGVLKLAIGATASEALP